MRSALSRILLLASVVAAASAGWVAGNAPSPYGRLWVLPLVLVVVAAMLYFNIQSGHHVFIIDAAITIIAIVRLLLLPLLIGALDDPFYGVGIELPSSYYDRGIAFMAYESLVTTALYCLFVRRMRKLDHPGDAGRVVAPGVNFSHWLLMLVGAASLTLPQVRERYSFFSATIDATAREIVSGYSAQYDVVAQVSNLARVAIPGVVAAWALRKYARKPSGSYVTIAALLAVAVNTFYVATSRASVFIPLLAAVAALAYLFPTHRGRVLALAGAGLALVTVVLTLRKSIDGAEDTPLSWYVNYVSTYFLGPREYAIGVRAVEDYGSRVDARTLVTDLVGNVPVVSGLVDLKERTAQFYNWTYLGGTGFEGGGFIVPASIQGAYYVGYILGPLFCAFALVMAARGQKYMLGTSATAFGSYVACFAMVVGSLYFTNAVSNVVALAAFPILPMVIMTWIARPKPRRCEALSFSEGGVNAP